ncbi:MAG: sodium:solute symporter family protein [Candidatus Amoebophilus sp.]
MNYFSIDFLIVYAFLATTLIIGIRAGRGIKDIREYAIGNKMYGAAILVFTFFATNIGGISTLDAASDVFSTGVIRTVAAFGVIIQILIVTAFVVPRMKHFNSCLTMGDVMGSLYGGYSQVLTGILGTLYSFCMIGMELFLLGIVFESLLGMPASWGIIMGGLLLTIYSAYGGIKSVTVTDVFQFLILFIVIPLIASIAINKVGGIREVFHQVPADRLKVFTHEKFSFYLTLFLIWSILPLGLVSPPHFQRLLMAKRTEQLRKQYLIVAGLDPLLQVTIMLIGLAGLVLYPSIQAADVMPHIIIKLLPIGIKGLATAGMLAVVMARTDSYLHTAGLLLVHDVIKPILGQKKIFFNELNWAKYCTLLIGTISIIIGLKSSNALSLSFGAMRIAGPVLLFPLLAGIIGLKPDKKPFYVSMVITVFTFIITTFYLPKSQAHLGVPISIVVNAISFFIVHLIQNRGVAMVDRNHSESSRIIPSAGSKTIQDQLKSYIPTLSNIIRYSQQRVRQYGAPYILFGIFFTINFTYPYFMWSSSGLQAPNLMLALRLVGAFACGLLIVQSKWPKSLLPYMPTYWHLTILYCLPFMSTMMFLLTQGSTEWLINIAIVIILLFILVDWVTAMILGVLGVSLAAIFYKLFVGEIHFSLDFSSKYLLLYQGIFGLLIGLIFARRKEQRFDFLLQRNQQLTEVQQKNRAELAETLTYREQLFQELNPDEAALFDEVTTSYIKQAIYRMTDYMRLDVTSISLDELQKALSDAYKLQGIEQSELLFHKDTKQMALQADVAKLKQLLLNAINYIQQYNTDNNPITIAIEDALLGHDIAHMQNYTRKLEGLKITITTKQTLPPTQPIYKIDPAKSSTWVPQHEDEFLLVENARIIDAHYGYMYAKSRHTQVYVFPVKLREIRGKVMELIKESAAADPGELSHPLAIQLEQELIKKLKGTQVDMGLIQKALDIIKKYHGGVKRKSGEPFFTHPITAALILLEYSQDQDAILGALLHDTVEDTSLSLAHIRMLFGETVAFLVAKATNLEDRERRISLTDKENLARILNYEDPRAALIKLSDRLHNMRTIQFHSSVAKRKYISQETLDYFVPLARKLGLEKIAVELEQLSRAIVFNN